MNTEAQTQPKPAVIKYTDRPRPKVFLPIPAYDWKVSVLQQCSLTSAIAGCHAIITPSWNCNDGIARSRNNLAWEFLQTDNEFLFFVDSDIVFDPVDVDRVVSHNLPVVGGMYSKKQGKLAWVFNGTPGALIDPATRLVEADDIGTGFVCVRRDALQKIMDAYPERRYHNDPVRGAERFDFFPMHAKDGRYLSEDWYFCKLAREAGIKLFIDTSVQVKHVGNIMYPLQASLTDDEICNIVAERYGMDESQVLDFLATGQKPPEKLNWVSGLGISQNHCIDVLRGEYDIGLSKKPASICDIGANNGAFARWAKLKWPEAKVDCYEPQPENFEKLVAVIKAYDLKDVQAFNHGILSSGDDLRIPIYDGMHNSGECSIHDLGEQRNTSKEALFKSCTNLDVADLVKIDTEGCELEIIEGMKAVGNLPRIALVCEYHREGDAEAILALLSDSFDMVGRTTYNKRLGILKFKRKALT